MNSTNLEQFKSTLLLSMERKIFFSVLSRRTLDFLLKNASTDSSVQEDSRSSRVPRGPQTCYSADQGGKLVETTMGRYHVLSKVKDLILNYYGNFSLRFTSGNAT